MSRAAGQQRSPPSTITHRRRYTLRRPASSHAALAPCYPDAFTTRKVTASGRIRCNGAHVTINSAVQGEWIGIERRDGVHQIYFADLSLGFIDDDKPGLGTDSSTGDQWGTCEMSEIQPLHRCESGGAHPGESVSPRNRSSVTYVPSCSRKHPIRIPEHSIGDSAHPITNSGHSIRFGRATEARGGDGRGP